MLVSLYPSKQFNKKTYMYIRGVTKNFFAWEKDSKMNCFLRINNYYSTMGVARHKKILMEIKKKISEKFFMEYEKKMVGSSPQKSSSLLDYASDVSDIYIFSRKKGNQYSKD